MISCYSCLTISKLYPVARASLLSTRSVWNKAAAAGVHKVAVSSSSCAGPTMRHANSNTMAAIAASPTCHPGELLLIDMTELDGYMTWRPSSSTMAAKTTTTMIGSNNDIMQTTEYHDTQEMVEYTALHDAMPKFGTCGDSEW